MTHSLYFVIRHKDFEKFKELIEHILAFEEFISVWQLVKNEYGLRTRGNTQPFFYFPEKDDIEGYDNCSWKGYTLNIETGSHVAPEDTSCALHWFYFTLAFKEAYKEELKSFEIYYHLDGDDKELTEEEIRKEIFGDL